MFENFTDRARKVAVLAMHEAGAAGDESIEPHHVLFGLIREGGSLAAQVLTEGGLERPAVADRVYSGAPKYTAATVDLFERARSESSRLGHEFVAPEHLLMSLVERPSEVVGRHLSSAKVDLHAMRQRVQQAIADPSLWDKPPDDVRSVPLGRKCPKCGASIETFGKVRDLSLGVETKQDPIHVHAYFCGECGSTYGLVKS